MSRSNSSRALSLLRSASSWAIVQACAALSTVSKSRMAARAHITREVACSLQN